jgi:hypothetical protein
MKLTASVSLTTKIFENPSNISRVHASVVIRDLKITRIKLDDRRVAHPWDISLVLADGFNLLRSP